MRLLLSIVTNIFLLEKVINVFVEIIILYV